MTPWLDDGDVRLYHGDCLDVLRELPDRSVHMCATSPPFYGLRDYGVDGQIGLEESPDQWVERLVEVFREVRRVLRDDGTLWVEIGDSYAGSWGAQGRELRDGDDQGANGSRRNPSLSGNQIKAAQRKQTRTGSIPPGATYKPKDLLGQPWMLAFALRADGWYLRSEIIWHRPNPMPESVTDRPTKAHSTVFLLAKGQWKSRVVALSDLRGDVVHFRDHVGPKNADVWAHKFGVSLATTILDCAESKYQLRLPALDSEIWQKRPGDVDGFSVAGLPVEHRAAVYAARFLSANAPAEEFLCELDRLGVTLAENDKFLVLGGSAEFPMPPGVDRYGKRAIAIHDSGEIGEIDFVAHELKFSRPSGCSYFYDADAIREKFSGISEGTTFGKRQNGDRRDAGRPNDRARVVVPTQAETLGDLPADAPRGPDGRRVTAVKGAENSEQHRDGERWPNPAGANARSVWTIPTEPTPFAHFATWPQKLVARMVLAGTSEKGCCPECGAAWVRVTERVGYDKQRWSPGEDQYHTQAKGKHGATSSFSTGLVQIKETTGWQPSCDHDLDPVPCVVLDPFAGSGTTLKVARDHGRHGIGIELNEDYLRIAGDRLAQQSLLTGDAA